MVDFRSIPAFCINLDSRPDRWESVKKQFGRLNWEVKRVSASIYSPKTTSRLTRNQAACMESHRSVWKLIADHPFEIAAVFEDDAVFPSDFEEVFPKAYAELPKDWNLWHLHSFGPDQMKNLIQVSEHITRLTKKGWGTHGYLIKKEFASEALHISYEITNQNVDVLLTHGVTTRGFCSYGVVPNLTLCFQQGDDSNIPETNQSRYWTQVRLAYDRPFKGNFNE